MQKFRKTSSPPVLKRLISIQQILQCTFHRFWHIYIYRKTKTQHTFWVDSRADGLSDGRVNGPANDRVDVRTDVAAPPGLITWIGLSTRAQVKRYLSQHLTDE